MERPLHKQSDENRDFCSGFCWQHSFIVTSSDFEPLEVKADDRKAKPAPQIKITLKIKRGKLNKNCSRKEKAASHETFWLIIEKRWRRCTKNRTRHDRKLSELASAFCFHELYDSTKKNFMIALANQLAEVEAARIGSKNVKHTRFRSILYGNLRVEIKQEAPIAKLLLVKASNRHKLCLPSPHPTQCFIDNRGIYLKFSRIYFWFDKWNFLLPSSAVWTIEGEVLK